MENYDFTKKDEQALRLLPEPNKRPFGDGLAWLKNAIALTRQRFGQWILISLIMNVCFLGVALVFLVLSYALKMDISFLSNIIVNILTVLFTGGLVAGMASLAETDELETSHLFAAFQDGKWKSLIILMLCVGLLFLLAALGVGLFMAMGLNQRGVIMVVAILIMLLYLVFAMMGFFTLALIMLHDVKPIDALKMSISGSLKNIKPILALSLCIFAIIFIVGLIITLLASTLFSSTGGMSFIGTIILGILAIVLALIMPIVNAGMMYSAYRNVWTNLPIDE